MSLSAEATAYLSMLSSASDWLRGASGHAGRYDAIMQSRDRLIAAIDRSSRDEILRLADALHGAVGVLKVGLQAFMANDPAIVRELVARGENVFLDVKVHHTPETANNAVAHAAALGAALATGPAAG